jgi:hypothetical protein
MQWSGIGGHPKNSRRVPKMICIVCGIVGADMRPNWQERAARDSRLAMALNPGGKSPLTNTQFVRYDPPQSKGEWHGGFSKVSDNRLRAI